MDPIRARQVLREAAARRRASLDAPRLLDPSFPQQHGFVVDTAKFISADCGRRAGKTSGAIRRLARGALETPGVVFPVIETTRTSMAAQVFWEGLKQSDESLNLGLRFDEQKLTATFPNRAKIQIFGADQDKLADRLSRGGAVKEALVDEAGHFRPSVLAYLIDEALGPACLDHDGTIVMIGTPSVVPRGAFFEACHSEEWSHHHWTCFDNPYLPHARRWVDNFMRKKGWDESHPVYRREWLGEWVYDSDGTVYKFQPDRNLADQPDPAKGDWRYVLGLDIGFNDSTAFVVSRYRRTGQIEIVESFKRTGMIPSAVAVEVQKLQQRHRLQAIVCDTGGIGKGYAEEMKQRYGIPVEAAQKQNKFAYIEVVNGELRSGQIKLVRNANLELVEELQLLQWADKDEQKISAVYEDHLADAFLYNVRHCRAGMLRWEKATPKPGDKGYNDWVEEQIWEEDLKAREGDGEPWWA